MSEILQPDPIQSEAKVPEIRIINRAHEGFRRGGVEHPADKTYPITEFTPEQILAFDAEPMLTVIMDSGTSDALEEFKAGKARRASKK